MSAGSRVRPPRTPGANSRAARLTSPAPLPIPSILLTPSTPPAPFAPPASPASPQARANQQADGPATQKGGRRISFTPHPAPLPSRNGAITPLPGCVGAAAHPKDTRRPPFSAAPTHPRTEAGPGGLHRPRTTPDTGPDRNSKGRRPGTAAGITATPRGSPRAEPVPTPGFRWKNMELRKPAPAAPGPHRFGVSRTTPGSAGVLRVVGSSSSSPLIPLGPGPGFRRTASATPLHPPLRLFLSAAPPTPPLRSLSSYSEG